ncbi:nickel ABC transporter permease [Paenibacillus medicaginis]|uniref:Nickel import system permease protein NikB n=1 Tax=Paenibacillus medicaginis TaxID=1470560 RepID=A0ABV5C2T9_9BACL
MSRYIVHRLLQLAAVLLGISFLTFLLTYLSPGDPARLMLMSTGVTPSEELVAQVRTELGLDEPFLVRYGSWVLRALTGDFGMSYKYGYPVTEVLLSRMPATLELAGAALLLVVLISFPLGMTAAMQPNRAKDYFIRVFSFAGLSMPSFWLGLLLMLLFAVKLQLLPVMGRSGVRSLILPACTLAVPLIAQYSRQIRTVLLEEMSQDYVIGAKARGVREGTIMLRYVLPNALLPLMTLLGMSAGTLLGGAAIIESVFGWPGVGQLALEAIIARDYPLIQGYVIWMAVIYVSINLVVDVWTHLRDPRLRLGEDV